MNRYSTSVFCAVALLCGCESSPDPAENTAPLLDDEQQALVEFELADDTSRVSQENLDDAVAMARELAALDPADSDDAARIEELSDGIAGSLGSDARPTSLATSGDPQAGSFACVLAYNLSLLAKAQGAAAYDAATTNYLDVGGPYSSNCYADATSAGLDANWGSLMSYYAGSSWPHRNYAIDFFLDAMDGADEAASTCNASYWWNGSSHAYSAWQSSEDLQSTASSTLVYLNLCSPS